MILGNAFLETGAKKHKLVFAVFYKQREWYDIYDSDAQITESLF